MTGRFKPPRLPPSYPRCSGCGAQCADEKSLQDHQRFCPEVLRKRDLLIKKTAGDLKLMADFSDDTGDGRHE